MNEKDLAKIKIKLAGMQTYISTRATKEWREAK